MIMLPRRDFVNRRRHESFSFRCRRFVLFTQFFIQRNSFLSRVYVCEKAARRSGPLLLISLVFQIGLNGLAHEMGRSLAEAVQVLGEVMFPNTVAYEKGRRYSYYIDQAGGFGQRAKKSRTIIIYMNGTVGRVAHNAKVRPGCEIVVPSKPKRNASAVGQWLGIGTSVASLATMIASLANLLK